MRLISTSITDLHKSQINILQRDELYFNPSFHCHPEFELVYIIEGFGKKVIGSKIESFKEGELLLIGSNIPHVWLSDKSFYKSDCTARSKALVVYFNPKIFSDSFFDMQESFYLNKLFKQSQSGIAIEGRAKELTILKLQEMLKANGFEKIICLLDILNTIAISDDLHSINEQNTTKQPIVSKRLSDFFDYINTNYKNNITLREAAKFTNLTPESFCRFFKQKAGKNFIDYLNETRINHACRFLLNTDLTVAEIAYNTGFKTVPGFNKLFKKFTGNSPTQYRKMIPVKLA